MENNNSELKRRFFATYYGTPARIVYGGEDLHIEADGWWPGLLEGDLTSYYLLLYTPSSEGEQFWRLMEEKQGRGYTFDYQRGLGMAVPFMGKTVQNLIDLGWIKLR